MKHSMKYQSVFENPVLLLDKINREKKNMSYLNKLGTIFLLKLKFILFIFIFVSSDLSREDLICNQLSLIMEDPNMYE